MLFGKAAIYFDEVVRRGALRRAADSLRIAPSAIDRQILQLEEEIGAPLFERTSSGMRMTAAGELLVDGVRRWRRDFQRIQSEIDNLIGLRRGEVTIGIIEGAAEFLATCLTSFRETYPGIHFRIEVGGAYAVVEQVLRNEIDLGITFNPPENPSVRVERTLLYGLGVVTPPDHPLATQQSVNLFECVGYPMIIPNENLSLRRMLDKLWQANMTGQVRGIAEVNNTRTMKALVQDGIGIGWLTEFDVMKELKEGSLVFVPVAGEGLEASSLSLITGGGRSMSVPASLFCQHVSSGMEQLGAPIV
ncbi:Transcriptional regulator, lysR family [Novosphingobium nitrogenifigens DSM 19370]|uniref:Transcriptional regulator, lysR family n=1 Tax=Novosphingobium nitrogenifigens DSM 19370 TaxID=983920 RepID=F1Z6J0_9SPHN|nr:LysR substrate-binding domain-containing protein [Novosphingobium nitrogenifigens]EGD59650.1 Transcriptional regulator, lysR family [Novosphingobium nitrogenifigens DSM 19370]